MKLILIGFATSYKTAAGKIVARKENCDFFDTDELIEKRENKTIAQIIAQEGESALRRVEDDVLLSVANANGVVSCGGGSALSQNFLRLKSSDSVVVWLKTSAETVRKRLGYPVRPLFDGLLFEDLQKKVAEREKIYEKLADICVVTDDKSAEEVADALSSIFNKFIGNLPKRSDK